MMPDFWQLANNPKLKFNILRTLGMLILGYADSYAKIFLILYPHLNTPQPVLP